MLADSANPSKGGDATARAYLHPSVDRAAGLPKRRRDIRVRLIPLAVLFFAATALTTVHQDRAAAAGDTLPLRANSELESVAGSSTIADAALQDLGTWQGQCFTWVKKVVDRATPYTMGYGYRDGYLGAGAIEVPLDQAVRGDIIQLANDNALGANNFYLGLHTAIVLTPLGGGKFDVIDSNQNWDEIVRLRPGYDPVASAARYSGISARVYRFPGASATGAPPPPATQLADGDPAVVDAGGDCLRLRATPSLSGTRIDCLPDGTAVSVTGAAVTADGLAWVPVDTYLGSGWVAAIYLSVPPDAGGAQPVVDAPVPADTSNEGSTPISNVEAAGYTLPVPPQGGLTQGPAGTNDPVAFIEAQAFPVHTLSVFDVTSQRYLTYIPGAPAHVNSLKVGTLDPNAIIAAKRADSGAANGATPSTLPVTGAVAFPKPPVGGLTVGVAGTTDVATLIAAQPFAVETLAAWDVSGQRFLTYISGAPAFANTLSNSTLRADMAVMIRSGGSTPVAAPVPPATPAPDQRIASITYYYCTQGSIPASIGDGGGWCGAMASGQVVYEGAAACAPQYMGDKFKILGDPTGRIYTCADTGGAVHGEHRDIFFHNSDDGYNWWLQVGATATIEVISS